MGLLGFCYILLEFILLQAHETDAKTVWLDAINNNQEIIYSGTIRPNLRTLKLEAVKQIKPDIIVIGSSRVNSFRASMFEPYSFYNCSRFFVSFENTKQLIDLLDEAERPKVIILMVEAFQFRNVFDIKGRHVEEKFKTVEDIGTHQRIFEFSNSLDTNVYKKLTAENEFIGVQGKILQRGFRSSDGSSHLGLYHNKTHKFQIKKHLQQAKKLKQLNERNLFRDLDQNLSLNTYDKYENLIKHMDSLGIKVIGIQLPFNQTIQTELDKDTIKYNLWHSYQKDDHLNKMKKIGNGLYYDFSRFSSFGGINTEMIDLIHPSEKYIGKIVSKMLDDEAFVSLLPKLNKYKIDSIIQSNPLPLYDVFSN